MNKKTLGRTNLEIIPIGFGGMELQFCNSAEACKLLNTVLDLGVNYIDTSPEYPTSEYYIGDHISKRRSEFYLATKCGDNMYSDYPVYIYDRKTCIRNLEDSLRLMKTDYLDLWQLHAVIPENIKNGKSDDVIKCMKDMQKEGKVRFIGATIRNGRPEETGYPDMFGYNSIEEFTDWGVFDVIQIVYGAMTRTSEKRIEAAVSKHGTGIIARGVMKQYKSWYKEKYEMTKMWELFDEGETMHDFLIRYVITNNNIGGMVVGTKSVDHFITNYKAAEKGPLKADVFAEAKRRLESAGFCSL